MTFLSSSPTLTNKESHPNLFQLIATENSLNPARVALMKHYGWTKAIVIYEAEEIFAYVRNTDERKQLRLVTYTASYMHIERQTSDEGFAGRVD